MSRINSPSIVSRAIDFAKQNIINPIINNSNEFSVRHGNGKIRDYLPTIASQNADKYQQTVNARRILDSGAYHNDARNNDFIYKGVTKNLTQTIPSPLKRIGGGISDFVSNFLKTPAKPQQNKQLVPTLIPTRIPTPKKILKFPLPTTTPYPSPTPIPGMGSGSMNADTNRFIETVILPMAQRYNVNPGIVTGQFANEGRLNGVGANRNNFYNIGVTDSMVAEAQRTGDWSKVPQYSSPEAGVERYLQFISGTGPDSLYANGVDGSATGKIGKKQFAEAWAKYRHDAPTFLKTIGPTYASSGDAYAQNTMNTPEYSKYVKPKELMAQLEREIAAIKKNRLTRAR